MLVATRVRFLWGFPALWYIKQYPCALFKQLSRASAKEARTASKKVPYIRVS